MNELAADVAAGLDPAKLKSNFDKGVYGTLTEAEFLAAVEAQSPVEPETTFQLTDKDKGVLALVHPTLEKIVRAAAKETEMPFMVFEGVRTMNRQRTLFKRKATRTMNSRHLSGHAVDLVPLIDGKPVWDVPATMIIAAAMFKAADDLGFAGKMRWGGDWDEDGDYYDSKFYDGPHFELKSKFYSSHKPAKRTKEYLANRGSATPTSQLRTKVSKYSGTHKTVFAESVQRALQGMGVSPDGKPIVVDGYYGEDTRAGVAAAQRFLGVKPVDGLWGPATGTAYRVWRAQKTDRDNARAAAVKRDEERARERAEADAAQEEMQQAAARQAATQQAAQRPPSVPKVAPTKPQGLVSDDVASRPVTSKLGTVDKAVEREKLRDVLPDKPAYKQATETEPRGGSGFGWILLLALLVVAGIAAFATFNP